MWPRKNKFNPQLYFGLPRNRLKIDFEILSMGYWWYSCCRLWPWVLLIFLLPGWPWRHFYFVVAFNCFSHPPRPSPRLFWLVLLKINSSHHLLLQLCLALCIVLCIAIPVYILDFLWRSKNKTQKSWGQELGLKSSLCFLDVSYSILT